MLNNVVKISGKIVKTTCTAKKVEITVQTTSVTRNNDIIFEYPVVRFDGSEIETAQAFKVYDQVMITGEIKTVKYYDENNEIKRTQFIHGTDIINKVETRGDKRTNKVSIKGVVKKIFGSNPNVATVIIGVEDGDTQKIVSSPKILAFGNFASFFKNQVDTNDYITVVGYIQTPDSKKRKGKVEPDDFIIVCEKAERSV